MRLFALGALLMLLLVSGWALYDREQRAEDDRARDFAASLAAAQAIDAMRSIESVEAEHQARLVARLGWDRGARRVLSQCLTAQRDAERDVSNYAALAKAYAVLDPAADRVRSDDSLALADLHARRGQALIVALIETADALRESSHERAIATLKTALEHDAASLADAARVMAELSQTVDERARLVQVERQRAEEIRAGERLRAQEAREAEVRREMETLRAERLRVEEENRRAAESLIAERQRIEAGSAEVLKARLSAELADIKPLTISADTIRIRGAGTYETTAHVPWGRWSVEIESLEQGGAVVATIAQGMTLTCSPTNVYGTPAHPLSANGSGPTTVSVDGKGAWVVRIQPDVTAAARDEVSESASPGGRAPAFPVGRVMRASGSGSKTTDEFAVGKKWKIVWTHNDRREVALFNVALIRDGKPIAFPVMGGRGSGDESFVYDAGRFSLSVTGTGDWTVEVIDLTKSHR